MAEQVYDEAPVFETSFCKATLTGVSKTGGPLEEHNVIIPRIWDLVVEVLQKRVSTFLEANLSEGWPIITEPNRAMMYLTGRLANLIPSGLNSLRTTTSRGLQLDTDHLCTDETKAAIYNCVAQAAMELDVLARDIFDPEGNLIFERLSTPIVGRIRRIFLFQTGGLISHSVVGDCKFTGSLEEPNRPYTFAYNMVLQGEGDLAYNVFLDLEVLPWTRPPAKMNKLAAITTANHLLMLKTTYHDHRLNYDLVRNVISCENLGYSPEDLVCDVRRLYMLFMHTAEDIQIDCAKLDSLLNVEPAPEALKAVDDRDQFRVMERVLSIV